MTYDEYYKIVSEKFETSIITKDRHLRKKIKVSMENWYKKNYEERIKQICLMNDEQQLINVSMEINRICNKDDLMKLKCTYEDQAFEKTKDISFEIFNKIQNFLKDNVGISKDEYDSYINCLEELKKEISPLFKDEYSYYLSEAILDLDYLRESGNVDVYSIRLYNYARARDINL